jgi:hypothetical protein
MAIRGQEAREKALLQVAEHAAEVGDSLTVVAALVGISDPALRDRAVPEIVLRVAASGQFADAVNLARLIPDKGRRDDVLAKLAQK